MKYLINRKTKEHRIAGDDWQNTDTDHWRIVQADSEGWIEHTGAVCPLPDDVDCEIRLADGMEVNQKDYKMYTPRCWEKWNYSSDITHYHPILEQAEKVQEPETTETSYVFDVKFDGMPMEPTCEERHAAANHKLMKQAEFSRLDVLGRLEMSHEYARQIPDLVAQLRDRLKPLGLGVMYLSEFDAFVEPEAAVETTQVKIDWPPCNPACDEEFGGYRSKGCMCKPAIESMQNQIDPAEDMTDWRNWRDNDLIMLKDGIKSGNAIIGGELYQITHKTKDGFWIDTKMQGSIHIMGRVGDFRFHSRPKGE
jgi:hypothetical protein